jgi:hypothetical protein
MNKVAFLEGYLSKTAAKVNTNKIPAVKGK